MRQKRLSAAAPAILMLSAVYLVSYVTRNSYNVVLPEMIRQTGFGQAELSLAVTGSLITYGAGQLLSGFFGDRFQPRHLVFGGLTVTALMNFMMSFCRIPALMLALWCINGLAQAFLWPPLVRLMAHLFSGDTYQNATVAVTWGGSIGNVLLYLTAPALIALCGLQSVFWAAALCGIAAAVVWFKKCPLLPESPRRAEKAAAEKPKRSPLLLPMVWVIMLAIVLQGLLRDGITTWTPVYIDQTFGLGSTFSILSGTALPLFSLAAIQGASLLHRRVFRNPLVCAAAIFGLGAVFGLALTLLPSSSAVLSVGLCALLTGCMHGVNLILICVLPAHFQKFGRVSLLSGALNACTYVGSALSAYGFAAVSELSGWHAVISAWPILAAAGAVICLLCAAPWKRFLKN